MFRKPVDIKKQAITAHINFFINPPKLFLLSRFSLRSNKKGKAKYFFAFPGYIRLRSDRGYFGANPPNYKEVLHA